MWCFSVKLLDHLCFLGTQDVPTGHRGFAIRRHSLERCKAFATFCSFVLFVCVCVFFFCSLWLFS